MGLITSDCARFPTIPGSWSRPSTCPGTPKASEMSVLARLLQLNLPGVLLVDDLSRGCGTADLLKVALSQRRDAARVIAAK